MNDGPEATDRRLRRYHLLALISTGGVAFLTVAGGVVRLTDSGLGCDDWPACNDERFIDVSSGHAAIEQINRLFSGVIGIPVLLLLVTAFLLRSRQGLRWPAVGVFVTVLANGVVGGFAVRGDLHPALVQSHFLLAMASIVFGVVAVLRSGPTPLRRGIRSGPVIGLSVALAVLTAGALVTGTIVTGTGPHAGDEEARRFAFDISSVARLHGATVIVTVLVAVAFAVRVARRERDQTLMSGLSAWLFLGMLQSAIGYTQYFNGVPELLVGIHIALATALWIVTVRLAVLSAAPPTAGEPGSEHDVHTGVDDGAPARV